MAKQIEGVSERILACAKEEFLEKGFSEASLRSIAAKADTTSQKTTITQIMLLKFCTTESVRPNSRF